MTLREILDFVNFNANKSQEGNSMSSDEFNTLLATFNIQMFENEFAAVEMQAKAQGVSVYDLLYTQSSLRPFRIKTPISTSVGVAALPSNYSHYITFIAKFGSQERIINVVSENTLNVKRTSLAESDPSIKPVVTIYDTTMEFLPKTLGIAHAVEMTYLKVPSTPFYDECTATDSGLRVYMPVGSTITSNAFTPDVPSLFSSAGVLIQEKVEHPMWNNASYAEGGGIQVYTSRTVELEWEPRMHLVMIQHLLGALGVNMRTPLQAQQK